MRSGLWGMVCVAVLAAAPPLWAQTTGHIAGTVIDQTNAIPLPGVPVEVVGTTNVAYTDLDGRYQLEIAAGGR